MCSDNASRATFEIQNARSPRVRARLEFAGKSFCSRAACDLNAACATIVARHDLGRPPVPRDTRQVITSTYHEFHELFHEYEGFANPSYNAVITSSRVSRGYNESSSYNAVITW